MSALAHLISLLASFRAARAPVVIAFSDVGGTDTTTYLERNAGNGKYLYFFFVSFVVCPYEQLLMQKTPAAAPIRTGTCRADGRGTNGEKQRSGDELKGND
jgi:hypothetical protein